MVLDLLHRCRNPLVIQLLIIAAVCYATADNASDRISAYIVGGMVFLSVFLSYFQETRSSRAVEKLQKMVKTTVTVLRDGKEAEVLLEEVVPGDVVVLAAGSLIPADLRILSAKDFFVTQSALTGESMPVEKNADSNQPAGRTPFECTNACFMGSNVLSGSARAVVLATGAQDLLRLARRETAGEARPDQLRQGRPQLHLADDPVHGRDGLGRLPDRRADGTTTGSRRCSSPCRWRSASPRRCCR